MRAKHIAIAGLSLSSAMSFTGCNNNENESSEKNNVLFIICDDLRPELGIYGAKHIKSPNIDRWAAENVIFERAYCNIAVSGASRASLLTGMRPTKSTLEKWNARADVDVPNAITIQEHFKKNGFTTIANGKVYHHQDEKSMKFWDKAMPPTPKTPMRYLTQENIDWMNRQKKTGQGKRGCFFEHGNSPEEDYLDHQIVTQSIRDLTELSSKNEPFFLSVGFILPHLPFVVPTKYWNLYNHDSISIPDNYVLKEGNNIPSYALANWSELRAYSGIPDSGPLDHQTAKLMIHGYYAAVSFIDSQIGRLLDALKELGLDKNTTVVLIGDHGWNLGEHGTWCKHSIMETSLHTPLIIATPKSKISYKNKNIVEFVDLYPTLCEAAGIPIPQELEGESLFPQVVSKEEPGKGYAVCRWANGFTYIENELFYTEWRDNQDSLQNRMLFDHSIDNDENYNVASHEQYQSKIRYMTQKLQERKGKNYNRQAIEVSPYNQQKAHPQ